MTQAALAAVVGVDGSSVQRWEAGTQHPERHLEALAEALQWEVSELTALLAGQAPHASTLLLGSALPDAAHPLGAGDVEALRGHIRLLIDIDNHHGGDAASAMAVQLFRSVSRRLGTGHFDPRYESDLYALTGELGEVAGWLLFDANQQGSMRNINLEARQLLQFAGDRSMELLVLQNMAMQADHLGRCAEAMRIARMVLDTEPRLTSRVRALFQIRLARALATAGDGSGALDTYDRAVVLYGDGIAERDPAWAWWFNSHEIAFHRGLILAADGQWSKATEVVEQSADLLVGEGLRLVYLRHATLLGMQARLGAWGDALQTMERLHPYVGEVGSGRTASHLHGVLRWVKSREVPASVREAADYLQRLLAAAGYELE